MAQAAVPGQPTFVIFKARPLPTIPYAIFEARPEDVLLSASSDEDSDSTRRAKRQRREDAGTYYLRNGQPKFISTARLKGPFKPEHVARQNRKRRVKTRTHTDPSSNLAVHVPDTITASRTQLGVRDDGERQEESPGTAILRPASADARSPSLPADDSPIAVRRAKRSSGRAAKEKGRTHIQDQDRAGSRGTMEAKRDSTEPVKSVRATEHAGLDEAQADGAALFERRPLKHPIMNQGHSEEQPNHLYATSSSTGSPFLYVPTRLRRRQKEQIEDRQSMPGSVADNAELDNVGQLLGEQGPNEEHFQEALAASYAARKGQKAQDEQEVSPESLALRANHIDAEIVIEPSRAQVHNSDTNVETPQDGQMARVSKPSTEALETERLSTDSDNKLLPLNTQAAFNEALAGFQSPEERFASIGKSRMVKTSRDTVTGAGRETDEGHSQELAMGTQALLAQAPRFSISPTKRPHPTQASKSPKEAQIRRCAGALEIDPTTQTDGEPNSDGDESPINLLQSAPGTSKRPETQRPNSIDGKTLSKSFDISARSFDNAKRQRSARGAKSKRGSRASQTDSISQNISSHSQGSLFGRVTKSTASRSSKVAIGEANRSSEWQDAQQDVFLKMDTAGKTSDEALDETIHDIQGFLESWTPG